MAITQFIPAVWSARLLSRLHKMLAYRQVVNTDYEGEISGFGDRVKINELGAVTVQDYTRNSTSDITWEYLKDAQKELRIDQAKYFAFAVDDLDAAQAKPKVMDEAMNEAAYAIRKEVDTYISGLYTEAGEQIAAVEVTDSNVRGILALARQKILTNGYDGPLWCVCPPWLFAKIAEDAVGTLNTDLQNRAYQTGMIETVHGITCVLSNNVYGDNGATSDTNRVLIGSRRSISFAGQVANVEATRPSKAFHDLVKGLYLYGAKVVRPEELLCLTASWRDQATDT